MTEREYLFTSESVTEGHPDKMADQVSDAVLDAFLAGDPHSRVAVETVLKTGLIGVVGEVTSNASCSFADVAREAVRHIGYDHSDKGFDCNTCSVMVAVEKQSSDIAQGVDTKHGVVAEQGAGDQGLMFGFACDETDELMPLPIQLAHRLTQRLAEVRKNGTLPFLLPDGKSQVTVRYKGFKPVGVETVVISSHHYGWAQLNEIRESVVEEVIKKVIPRELLLSDVKYYVNPTGRFVIGGPMGDSGVTGRKIIVDTYGGMARHGGGAFSGKDPSKVDRSAAYMARYVAKNVVAAGLASRCELQVAYAIGVAEPVSIMANTHGTERVPQEEIENRIRRVFSFKPAAIIETLDLLRPIYRKTAAYGHFGRPDQDFAWERTDKVDALR